MSLQKIRTGRDFREFIQLIVDNQASSYKHSLQAYLQSLWALIQDNREHDVSYDLIAKLLEDAFSYQVPPFDANWLQYK